MFILPAIDLLDGDCVRLFRGNYGNVTVYGNEPADIAKRFEDAGAVRIHIVDLDAARGQAKNNRRQLEKIRRAVSCTLEVGGGVRTERDVRELLDLGIDRLVAGTLLASNPEIVAEWVRKFGRVVIAGIDALDGEVKISGWEHGAGMKDTDLALRARELGMRSIIYTNISQDGTLAGPDIGRTKDIAKASGLPVILSGGIGSMKDIEAASREEEAGVVAVITGKAIYEGKIDLAHAIRTYQKNTDEKADW